MGACLATLNLARDHPREYGENTISGLAGLKLPGSSPRIRGKYEKEAKAADAVGIIPANTGKMASRVGHVKPPWDHPREYGENSMAAKNSLSLTGSSPRIRGKCQHRARFAPRGGIIPANTGKIPEESFRLIRVWDHPREYGENMLAPVKVGNRHGSSPRIRGKSALVSLYGLVDGIIPANTGKIRIRSGPAADPRDHPREYGENQIVRRIATMKAGSSPRIRGKLWDDVKDRGLSGDHPREYGEN